MKHQAIENELSRSDGEILKPSALFVSNVQVYAQKCRTTSVATLFGGTLGGVLIGIAGLFYLIVMTDNNLDGGIAKLIGGASFSLGLVMISVIGAELFTGNVMAILPAAYRLVSAAQVVKNWVAVFVSNFAGALAVGLAANEAGMLTGPVRESLDGIVMNKLSQGSTPLFVEATLCNILVCLAIWMGLSTRDPAGRVLFIAGPITAFVAMGLEHSIANMFFFSAAYFSHAGLPLGEMSNALAIVTVGNILGASLLVTFLAFSFRNTADGRRLHRAKS